MGTSYVEMEVRNKNLMEKNVKHLFIPCSIILFCSSSLIIVTRLWTGQPGFDSQEG